MRQVCKLVLSLTVFGAGVAAGGEGLDLPTLPPPPPATGGEATAPAADLPAIPAPAAAPAFSAPAARSAARSAAAPVIAAEPTTTAAAFSPASGGVAGKITGGRVNIRSGEGTRFEIVQTAPEDTQVTVYRRNGEWVQIGYPETESCYTELTNIDGVVPADVPESGIMLSAKGGKIYSRPWQGSTEVGTLAAGESVTVTGVRNQFVKIKPTSGARAYVFYKYVTFEKGSVPESGAVAETPAADKKPTAGTTRPNQTGNRRTPSLDQIKGDSDPVLETVRKQNSYKQTQQDTYGSLNDILGNLEAGLKQAEAETQQQLSSIDSRRIDPSRYQRTVPAVDENYRPKYAPGSEGGNASGFVEFIGSFRGRPAYRLVQGGVIQYLLVSTRFDLNKVVGKRVLINGAITSKPEWDADLMNVDFLRLYTDPNTPLEEIGGAPAPRRAATASVATDAYDDESAPVRTTTERTVIRRPNNRVVVDVTGMPDQQ